MAEDRKTSREWERLAPKEWKLVIMDPDGWDRTNYHYSFDEELITKEEFMNRVSRSTCMCSRTMFEVKWE